MKIFLILLTGVFLANASIAAPVPPPVEPCKSRDGIPNPNPSAWEVLKGEICLCVYDGTLPSNQLPSFSPSSGYCTKDGVSFFEQYKCKETGGVIKTQGGLALCFCGGGDYNPNVSSCDKFGTIITSAENENKCTAAGGSIHNGGNGGGVIGLVGCTCVLEENNSTTYLHPPINLDNPEDTCEKRFKEYKERKEKEEAERRKKEENMENGNGIGDAMSD